MGKDEAIPELGNRTWAELETVEDETGALLFKDELKKRTPDGWTQIPIRVRIPRPKHLLKARAEARGKFAELKLDPERDRDVFDELEQLCILALAIRTAEKPHAQFADVEELSQNYDDAALQDVLGRIAVYRQLVDPRDSKLTEDQMFEKIHAVAKRGHLGPLTDIAGPEQPSFIIFMAEQAMSSPKAAAWRQSLESSTPERSPVKTSNPS